MKQATSNKKIEKYQTTKMLHAVCCMLREKRGSTLLLGILIVSVIVSSTFIVGRITLRNLNQVRTVVDGEKVILAAEAGLEQGLWAHVRDEDTYVGNCDEVTVYKTTDLDGVKAQNCRSYLLSTPELLSFARGTSQEIFLIDPTDTDAGAKYKSVSFTHVKGNATVKLCDWEVTNCATGAGTTWSHSSGVLNITNLQPSSRYIILITPGSSGDYQVLATGLDSNDQSRGLPADYVTVEGRGEHVRSTGIRTLEMQVLP